MAEGRPVVSGTVATVPRLRCPALDRWRLFRQRAKRQNPLSTGRMSLDELTIASYRVERLLVTVSSPHITRAKTLCCGAGLTVRRHSEYLAENHRPRKRESRHCDASLTGDYSSRMSGILSLSALVNPSKAIVTNLLPTSSGPVEISKSRSALSITAYPVFTIGHSNHSPEAFLRLLQRHDIGEVVDVRSLPIQPLRFSIQPRYLGRHFVRRPHQLPLAGGCAWGPAC